MPFPINVDTTYHGGPIPTRVGPWATAAAIRYLIYHGPNGVQGGGDTLAAMKSIDNGQTWVAMDQANAPSLANAFNPYSSCYDGAGKIWTIYIDSTNKLKAVSFDTTIGMDKWGLVHSSGITIAPGDGLQYMSSCFRSADGLIPFVTHVGSVAVGLNTCFLSSFGTFDPGSNTFSALVAMGNIDLGAFDQAVIPIRMIEGAGGLIHVALIQNGESFPADCQLMVQSFNVAGVLGFVDLIASTLGTFLLDPVCDMVYDSSVGKVTLFYARFDSGGSGNLDDTTITILRGASLLTIIFGAFGTITSTEAILTLGLAAAISPGGVIDAFWVADDTLGAFDFFVAVAMAAISLVGNTALFNLDGLAAVLFSDTSYGLAWGDEYWEVAAAPAPVVVNVLSPLLMIFPFPAMADCCYPMVSCVRRSKDGKVYVPSKGILKRGY